MSDLNENERMMLEIIGTLNHEPTATTSETVNAWPEDVKKGLGIIDQEFVKTLDSLRKKGYVRVTGGYVSGVTNKGREFLKSKL